MEKQKIYILNHGGGSIVGAVLAPFAVKIAFTAGLRGIQNLISLAKINAQLPKEHRWSYTKQHLRNMMTPKELLYTPAEMALVQKISSRLQQSERNTVAKIQKHIS